ncbi:MAG: SBBP repeat-containing protein [Planctomycetota bacterium]|nr:SBBP repeat-containing protein [Planctomycetota bacterium]
MTPTTRQFLIVAAGWTVALLGVPALATSVNEDWTARYSQGADDDEARDIVLDDAGNVYITGQTIRNTQSWDWDYITIKYNSSGQQLWAKTYNSPGDGQDYGRAIDLDSEGHVYVTGRSDNDCVTIKYDTNGNQLWLKRTENADGYDIQLEPLSDSNVFVTGRSGQNTFTIRYLTSNGTIKWIKTDIAGFANALAVTHGGDACIAGQDSNYDYVVAKYDFVNGTRLWKRTFDRGGMDMAHDIVIDDAATVYVTGESRTSDTDWDAATVSWDLYGTFRWSVVYNGPANGWDRAFAIGLCNYGNVRIGGYSENPDGNRDFLAVKYDGATGGQMWAATHDGPDGNDDIALDLAVDAERSVYLTGYTRNDAGDDDYMTVKFDTVGVFQWEMIYAGPNGRSYMDDKAYGIAVDDEGYVLITGESYGPASDDDCLTICYSQSSDCPWDFDGDGDVDTADLLYLLGAWGTPDGDVNDDGTTDTADLLDLLGHWGQCP